MSDKDKLILVKNFIYSDDVQNILSEINDNVMDFNILEITGMGSQEIKHSNILGWLFDDSEHNLEYQILDGFIKNILQEKNNSCEDLKTYIYLARKKRDITIYREKDNIDLLIIDKANEIVIVIENKIYADESENQLTKYKKIIKKKYSKYKQFFIYLTIDLEEASEGNDDWLLANHQMINNVIIDILKLQEVSNKTKIVLESYIDLLKRNGIVADKSLEELCNSIWSNKKYRDALNILIDNKSSNVEKISKIIIDRLESMDEVCEYYEENPNEFFVKTKGISDELWNEDKLFFQLSFGYDGIFVKLWIGQDDESCRKLYPILFPDKNKYTKRNTLLSIKEYDWKEYVHDIGIENLEEKISEDLDKIFAEIKSYAIIIKNNL